MASVQIKKPIKLIGVPWDEHSSFRKGTAGAPPEIRKAFHSYATNTWCEDGFDVNDPSILTDTGDIEIPVGSDPLSIIEQGIRAALTNTSAALILGGDHAVTYPVLKAMAAVHGPVNLLHFDAHPDLYNELEGDRLSHACPFARIMEEGLASRLVQVGIRCMNGHQQAQADKFGVEVIQMKQFSSDLVLSFDGPLYISFDLDVLDPAFAPGVSHHEPGGMSTREAVRVMQQVQAPVIVGADIVELNPSRDRDGVSAMVCAKMLKEISAAIVRRN